MPGRLTRDEVERIAALAHLELTPDEVERYTPQLADILEYAARLAEVDPGGDADDATWHAGGDACPQRDDQPRASLDRDATLTNAPDGVADRRSDDGGFFRVPRVLGS